MQLEILENAENASRLALSGRLDSAGVDSVEIRFTAATVACHRHALVDFSDVSFIASMGIRMLVTVAKALDRNGYKLIVIAPQELVAEVVRAAAIERIVSVASDEAEAMAMLEG